ncbi:MAG: hypothetical protein M3443_10650 [Actinomycetota bacterium]|nr:hypothetical protein [Actinomycetota bacterium]
MTVVLLVAIAAALPWAVGARRREVALRQRIRHVQAEVDRLFTQPPLTPAAADCSPTQPAAAGPIREVHS